jgi:pimeloyl-ACP methyl ester carboxylesterase
MTAAAGPANIEVPGPWQHRYVAANGARFHLAEAVAVPDRGAGHGEPPLVLLLHGFPEFWWAWRDQLPALAAHGYRAAALDLRGYGGSDKLPRGYDAPTLAADVSAVVKALGERTAFVVGHGWGGYVAWAVATLHRREVRGLCAVSAPHPRAMIGSLPSRAGLTGLGHLLAMQPPFVPERRLSRPGSTYVRDHLRAWSAPGSGFPSEQVAARYHDALQIWPSPHCALEYHRWLVRSRLRADGRRFNALMEAPVTVPTCLVVGSEDRVVPARAWVRSRRRVSGAFECHTVSGAGHFPHEERPAQVTGLMLDWLDRCTRSFPTPADAG